MSGGKQGGIITIVRLIGQWFLDCLFPKHCFDCGKEGEYLCVECSLKTCAIYPAVCFGCHKPVKFGELCNECSPRFAFDRLIIAADYEDELIGAMIKACKYRFVQSLTEHLSLFLYKPIAEILAKDESPEGLAANFFKSSVIAMPLSSKRRRWRGFNQSELLANTLASYFSLKRLDILTRRHRKTQAKLNEAERLTNLNGSFSVTGAVPEYVILVDDVVTTGATLHEAAKALKADGAEEVWGVVVAKG